MSLVEKFKSFWLGAEESYEDGFDDLFRIDGGVNANREQESTSTSNVEAQSRKANDTPQTSRPHLKVLEHSPYSATNEVVVLEPTSFSQAPDIIQYLRKGSSVVLNLCRMDAEQSQRLVDFVCGGIYAVDGSQRRVGEGVFLLVPSSVNINSMKEESNRLSRFWSNPREEM